MIRVLLKPRFDGNSNWVIGGHVYVCGYAYLEKRFMSTGKLHSYFSNMEDIYEIRDKAVVMNGVFSLIVVLRDRVLAISDRYGVNKIFYRNAGYSFLIGDDAWEMSGKNYLDTLNPVAVKEWNYCGFVSYDESLIKNLNTLNASKYLLYDKTNRKVEVTRYHSFRPSNIQDTDLNHMTIEFSRLCVGVGERLTASLNGKTALIPLSGGMNSRFCAELLRRQNYKKVVCFTYGKRSGEEESVAREVADRMGFLHVFIPHRACQWKNLFRDESALKYIRYASQLKATPLFSDWFPAKELAEIHEPSDCVIIPGLVGSVAKSTFDSAMEYSNEDIIRLLIKNYFNFYHGYKDENIYEFLYDRLEAYKCSSGQLDGYEAQGCFDNAAYDTYRSNHLLMAVKPYEYFGFDIRVPLMDSEVVDFFKHVPLAFKGKEEMLLGAFVSESPDSYRSFHKEPTTYMRKFVSNLMDTRYNCINPLNVFKLRKGEYNLPPLHKTLYGYYRNYLSYVSAMTLNLILKGDIGNREN